MVLQFLLFTHIRFFIWKINHVKYQCKTHFAYPTCIFNNKIWSKIDCPLNTEFFLDSWVWTYAGGKVTCTHVHTNLNYQIYVSSHIVFITVKQIVLPGQPRTPAEVNDLHPSNHFREKSLLPKYRGYIPVDLGWTHITPQTEGEPHLNIQQCQYPKITHNVQTICSGN